MSNVIPLPVVNKRTGQSPTLGELTKTQREPVPEWLKVLLKNFGGVQS